MIAKGKSISHGASAIDYALDKDKAELIEKRHVIGDNGTEIKNEFKIFQDLNQRCEVNDISFVLSPEPTDGQKLTNKEFQGIADDFLKKMKLDKNQAIVVKHNDKAHAHLHIIVNRINTDGNAYKDKHISKKAQKAVREIAQERGLTCARKIEDLNKEMQKLMNKEIKRQIFDKHKAVLEHTPKNFKEYSDLMKSSGVEVLPSINKQGNLQGFRVKYQGVNLKASEVHKTMTLSKMGAEKVLNKTIGKTTGIVANLNPTLKIARIITKTIYKGLSH